MSSFSDSRVGADDLIRLLAEHHTLRARRALRLDNNDTLEWGTPVRYLRALEGRIVNSTIRTLPSSWSSPATSSSWPPTTPRRARPLRPWTG